MRSLVLTLSVALSVAALCAAATCRYTVYGQRQEIGRTWLESRLRQAKEKGERKVVLLPVIDLPEATGDLEQALSSFNVVLAGPAMSKSYVMNGDSIATWYKFKILEDFSKTNLPACRICSGRRIPNELLPLEGDEFAAMMNGGALVVDGVEVVQADDDLPPFSPSQKYLLFFRLDPQTKVGILSPGAAGVFVVSSEGTVNQVGRDKRLLAREMEAQYGNSLERLRAAVKR